MSADQRPPADGARPPAPAGRATDVAAFLEAAREVGAARSDHALPRLIFALDATMSRGPTWDAACAVQGAMFAAAAELGGLAVQLAYYRGLGECRASRWVADPGALGGLMGRIAPRGGRTQIARLLGHVRDERARAPADAPLRAFVFVGDAVEEDVDALCALAGEVGLLGVKGFLFHEGDDPAALAAFREIARLTGGAAARFDAAAPGTLAALLRAGAAYASGGLPGLRRLAEASRDPAARGLLAALAGPRA